LKPKGGVVRVAGPSYFAVVLSQLLVEEGETVQKGQVIAILDTYESLKANLAHLEASLVNTERQYQRLERLFQQGLIPAEQRDDAFTQVETTKADIAKARADLEQALVRSPVSGQVLKVQTRSGEKVGNDGIVEIGQTSQMQAVAEVYETDIGRVRIGQRAQIQSPVLATPLSGTVVRIGRQIGKMDVLATDPVARTDARVVEVEVRLDDSRPAATLTNLQVEVSFEP
jgi:HlyD family secretion protein